MWAGAGGAGRYNSNASTSGASGFVSLAIDLTAGDTLTIEVGGGGKPGRISPIIEAGAGGWPDGGDSVRGDTYPGGGGGSSRVYLNGALLAVCGAGGGSAGYSPGGNAGAGGGEVGQSCSSGDGGTGGTQTQGGVDANAPTVVAKKGGYLQGGLGGVAADRFTSTSDDGGGGGGGYYGGGGGGGDGRSGGGGSSWVNAAAVVGFALVSGNYAVPPFTDSPYYAADVGVGRPSVSVSTGGLAGGDGRVVVDDEAPLFPVNISKSSTAVVLKSKRFEIMKTSFAAVTRPGKPEINKASVAVVLKEADPEPVEFEFDISKASVAVVMAPGANGPLTRVSHISAEIVRGGTASARVSQAAAEVLQTRVGAARVSNLKLETLYTRGGAARATHASLEVLRSTAEVTVQALVTNVALDYLYVPDTAQINVSQVAVEVLRTAEAENDRFAVISLMN